jgi:flagellar M-ring protein FliF
MDFKTVVAQITKLFGDLNKKQKIIIASSTLFAISFIVFLVLYTASKSDKNDGYRVLFSNLSPTDSAQIVQQLEADNIPYKLINEGTIKVPKDVVYRERITVASMGIPKNHKVGFELFDTQNFGETDFAQNIKYLRALEGELERTIQALNPIEDANVKIALPKDSVFVEKQTPPTASVVVKTKEGMRLTSKQTTGIKNLVASAVPKLEAANVKIIDQDGNLIDDENSGISDEDVQKQLRYKRDYEKALEKKIIKILAPIIGSDKRISAKVTADFDFNQKKIHDEHYDPDSVVRSEQSLEEKKEGGKADSSASGVPGAISNITPTKPLGKNGKTNQKYEKSTTTTNYEISKKITDIKGEFATLKRVSAAVVVDGKYEENKKQKELIYKALSQKEMTTIENIVKRAIGFDKKRGDEVTVSNMKFTKDNTKKVDNVEKTAKMITPFLPILKYLLAAVALFIFYKKIISPFSQKMLEDYSEEDEEFDLGDEEIEEESENETLDKYNEAKRKIEKELGLDEEMDEESIKHSIIVDKMKDSVNEHPEDLAKLIESLMRNE